MIGSIKITSLVKYMKKITGRLYIELGHKFLEDVMDFLECFDSEKI